MKSTFTPAAVALASVLAFGFGTVGAQAATDQPGASGAASSPSTLSQPATSSHDAAGSQGGFITQQKSSQLLATNVIGMSIRNSSSPDAKEIGKVTDLIMDQDHKLVGVVVGVGGFLGIGQKDVGIPWSQVKEIVPDAKTAVVSLSKEQLEKAPEFVTTKEKNAKAKAASDKARAAQQRSASPMAAPPPPQHATPGTPPGDNNSKK